MTNFCLDFCIRLKLQNCQISSELDLLMRPAGIVYQWTQTPVSGFIGRRFKVLKSTSFATKKVNAFQVNFSEFNNKLVAAFTTNGVENSVSFHVLLFALDAKKRFYYISSVLSGVVMFRTYQ